MSQQCTVQMKPLPAPPFILTQEMEIEMAKEKEEKFVKLTIRQLNAYGNLLQSRGLDYKWIHELVQEAIENKISTINYPNESEKDLAFIFCVQHSDEALKELKS